MARDADHLIYVITAIVCFLLGYYSFSQSTSVSDSSIDLQVCADGWDESLVSWSEPWQRSHDQDEEVPARRAFQELLRQQHQQQFLTDCSRVLMLPIQNNNGGKLSWIDSLQVMTRALKVALSTKRRLIVQLSGDKEDSFCQYAQHEIYCQFMRKRNCYPSTDHLNYPTVWTSPLRQGVEGNKSDFFNVQYYGNEDVVVLPNTSTWPWPKSWLLEGGLSWERSWGAFWLNSQLLHYLTGSKMSHPEKNFKEGQSLSDPIHITLVWDPAADQRLKDKFARNPEKTHAWDRIQVLANSLRAEYIKEIKQATHGIAHGALDILIITNQSTSTHAIPVQSWEEKGWKVSIIQIDPREKPQQHVLESLYSSACLIGSFASPFFRVFTALHKANSISHSIFGMRRYWALDIEWLENFHDI